MPVPSLRTVRRWFALPEPPPYRVVEVHPLSRADEGGWVFLAAGVVLLGVIYAYGFEREASRGLEAARGSASGMLPYQVLFRDLPAGEQRSFRAMQEGVGEAVRERDRSGTWPSVAALADDGIPPFASDVLDRTGLRWTGRSEGLLTNYLGVPSADAAAPAFLIFVQEPDPVTGEKAPAPSVVDEEHQLLSDGKLLHVTFWKRAAQGVRTNMVVDPPIEGWTQIRVATPYEEMAKNENLE